MPLQMYSAVRYSYDTGTGVYTKQIGSFDGSGWTYDDEPSGPDNNVASVGEHLEQSPDFSFEDYVGWHNISVAAGAGIGGGNTIPVMVTSYFVGAGNNGADAPYQWLESPVDGLTEDDYPATFTQSQVTFGDYPIALCFAAGTQIVTTAGETSVEALRIGDLVRTQDGRTTEIKWVGRQTLSKFRHGTHMQPVRIRRGALGDGLPHTDLTVTADHGMVIDGYVINASALVNGDTIDYVPMPELDDIFTVYHVETENHDVILANGAPAETYIDYRDRRSFDNYQEYLDLYGAEQIIPEMPLPRVSSARFVPLAIKTRIGLDHACPSRRAG